MNAQHSIAAVVLSVMASANLAATLVSSTFDAGSHGWRAVNGASSFAWHASGGDPDGHIQASDVSGQTLWFFSAPSAYLGDKLAAYGGSLSFALKSDSDFPPLAQAYADVHLLGNNGVRLVFSGNPVPTTAWTVYNIGLVADGAWKLDSVNGPAATVADFAGVLSSLHDLRIRGDYTQAVETTSLDSVVLAAVPEPGSAALWLAGLAAAALLVRRRRH